MRFEVLSRFHMPWLTVLALVLFFGFFIGMLFWVNRRSSRSLYQTLEKLPLHDKGGNT